MVFGWTGRVLCLALALGGGANFACGWPVWARGPAAVPAPVSVTAPAPAPAPAPTQAAKSVNDYVYFAGANDFGNPEIRTFETSVPKSLQEFTGSERAQVTSLLNEIYRKCPALIVAASGNQKIALVRVITFLPMKLAGYSRSNDVAGLAGPSAIMLSNSFFAPELAGHTRLSMLAHELVHVADCGYRVQESKMWIDFAGPIMAKLRLRSQFSTKEGQRFYNRTVKDKNIWPGLYAAANLAEALADYLTCDRSAEVEILRAQPDLNRQVVEMLLVPDTKERDYTNLVKEGRIYLGCKDDERARRSFLEAQKLFSGSPTVDLLVACSYGKDAKDLVLQTEIGEQKVDILRLPSIEWTTRGLLILRSGILQFLRRFDESKIVLDRFLKIDPFDERMLKRQSINYFVLGKLGSSLDAAYRSRGFRGLSFNALTDLDSDPDFAKRAIAEISKSPSLRYRLNAHAQYCMQLAESLKEQDDASKLYELARKDYIESLEIDDKSKLDTLICCFDLSLKLIDFVAAKKYYKLALRLDKEAIPTKIAEVKFLEAMGDRKAARALYLKIGSLVADGKCDQSDSTGFTFQYLEPEAIQRIDAQFLGL